MDANTIQTAIGTLGFPIVCVIFLAWFIWNIWMGQQDQNKQREDKLYEFLGKAQAMKFCCSGARNDRCFPCRISYPANCIFCRNSS